MNFELLHRHWANQQKVRAEAGISPADIAEFEKKYRVVIPDAFAKYLQLANGLVPKRIWEDPVESDDEGFVFYPLAPEHLISSRYLIFAHWWLGLIDYAICLDPLRDHGKVVIVVDSTTGRFLAEDFSSFVGKYLSNMLCLYSGGPEVVSLD